MSYLTTVKSGDPEYAAWREFYQRNKVFTKFFPPVMTVTDRWPPSSESEVREFVRRFVDSLVAADNSRLDYAQKVEKYTPRPMPRPLIQRGQHD